MPETSIIVRLRSRTALSLLLAGVFLLVSSAAAQALPRDVRVNLISATVEVIPWDDTAGELVSWSGSGTIISPDGYVLTNFHVIGDMQSRQYFEWHGIFMTDVKAADLPPQLAYWARYVAGDPLLDLAVLRIEEFPDETPIPSDIAFPAVPVGDSNTLLPGDELTVIGYPGISGHTITFTKGIMSGWLGEDHVTGGRQWIKTDAKIARGNSGGAAVNERGELIGVPTSGQHTLDGVVYEEQLYIRPISLAWALIGPHVPNVHRPGTPAVPVSQPVQAAAPVEVPPAAAQQPVLGSGVPSGNQGALAIGQSLSKTAAAATPEFITWHGYAVSVPAGQPLITISVTSDDDIDFAYSFGREIENWLDVDYLNESEEFGGSSTVTNPPAGILHIDVLNAYQRPINYTISVSGAALPPAAPAADPPLQEAASQEPAATPPFGAPAAPPAVQPPFGAPAVPQEPAATPPAAAVSWPPPAPFGRMGSLQTGQQIVGNLLQDPVASSSTFHTWDFQVPAGAAGLTVSLESVGTLDVALRYGAEITSYAEPEDGGDWQYWEWGPEGGGLNTLQVSTPTAGTWYLDVINYGNQTVDGRYTLRVDVH